jgi:hypothetical protein
MHLAVMLFQTGYLTIKEKIEDPIEGMRYRMGFPNLEVRSSFSRLALDTALETPEHTADTRNRLREVLHAGTAPHCASCSPHSSSPCQMTTTATTPLPAMRASMPPSCTHTSPAWALRSYPKT